MYNTIKKLTKHELKILKKNFQSLIFNNDFNLVYESQVPNTGIVLINGELTIFKKKKIHSTIKPGTMLGVYEVLNNAPVDHGCKVIGMSELIIIQKSDILAAMDDKDSELYTILTKDIA